MQGARSQDVVRTAAWRRGLVIGLQFWAGHLGVLVPCGAIAFAASGPPLALYLYMQALKPDIFVLEY